MIHIIAVTGSMICRMIALSADTIDSRDSRHRSPVLGSYRIGTPILQSTDRRPDRIECRQLRLHQQLGSP